MFLLKNPISHVRFVFLFLLKISFGFLLGCQNGQFGAPNSQNTERKSNGHGYSGILKVESSSDSIAPGGVIDIQVSGGQGPYDISSNSKSGVFEKIDENNYRFAIGNESLGGVIFITVKDSFGATANVEVKVLGINKWFYSQIEDISEGLGGTLYFLESNQNKVIQLDRNGNELKTISYQDLMAPDGMSMDKIWFHASLPFGYIYSNSLKVIYKVSTSGVLLSKYSTGSFCQNVKTIDYQPNYDWVFFCDDDQSIQFYKNGQVTKSISLLEILQSNEVASFSFVEDSILVFSKVGGIYKLDSSGNVISKSVLTRNGEVFHEPNIADAIVSGSDLIYFLDNKRRHVVIANELGVIRSQRVMNGTGIAAVTKFSSGAIIGGEMLAVSDPVRGSIIMLDLNGAFLRQFSSNQYFAASFYNPKDLQYDESGNLYVLDSGNQRLQVFDQNLELMGNYSSKELASGAWWGAEGIGLGQDGNLLVANSRAFSACQLNLQENQLIEEYGTGVKGSGLNQLNYPVDIAESPDGRVYISDKGNHRIVIYKDKKPYKVILNAGNQALRSPSSLSVLDNRLYVMDEGSSLFHVFDLDGVYIKDLNPEIHLDNPKAFEVRKDGIVVVANSGKNEVFAFDITSGKSIVLVKGEVQGAVVGNISGVSLNEKGRLAVSDSINDRVLIVDVSQLILSLKN